MLSALLRPQTYLPLPSGERGYWCSMLAVVGGIPCVSNGLSLDLKLSKKPPGQLLRFPFSDVLTNRFPTPSYLYPRVVPKLIMRVNCL